MLEAAGIRAQSLSTGFDTAFEELGATGVCTSVGEYQQNAYGVALPVSVGSLGTPMALSCGAVDSTPDIDAIRNRIAPALKQTARDLTALLSGVAFEP